MSDNDDAVERAARALWKCWNPTTPAWAAAREEDRKDTRGQARAALLAARGDAVRAASTEVIDAHMRKVAHRVMDVFENANEDALAEEIMGDVFSAIGLIQAFGALTTSDSTGDIHATKGAAE